MTKQLLAQAVAVAYNPHSSPNELIEIIGDLVNFGAFDAAEEALRRLRLSGKFLPLVGKMEKAVNWLRNVGINFEDAFLARAIAVADDESARPEQLLGAAECLIVWGSLDEGDRALARLQAQKLFPGPVARLAAASRQLRRSGILEELKTLTPAKSLNKPYEVLIRRRAGAQRTIVVFTGVALRFWLSLNALHLFLRKLNANVVYLSDHTACMYLNGLASVAPSYDQMVDMLREQLRELGDNDLHVLASSAGGFVGLRTAIDLKAQSFAGMSIRTTLASKSSQMAPVLRYAVARCRDPSMLVNLRDMVVASDQPRRIQLYCGESNPVDRAHAENLQGIPRVDVIHLKAYRPHDAISGLIARGEFEPMLRRFVADSQPAAATTES
jgi:hypothetical protein